MPFRPVHDCNKIEIVGHSTTTLQPIVNILHSFMLSTDQTSGHLQAQADAVDNVVGNLDITSWADEYVYDQVVVTALETATAPQAISVVHAGATGTGASAPLNACAVTKFLTGTRGRSYRGRAYWSPLKQSYVSNGSNITVGARDTWDTLVADLQTALGALTPASFLVVASLKLGTANPITSSATELEMGSQRRRLVGR